MHAACMNDAYMNDRSRMHNARCMMRNIQGDIHHKPWGWSDTPKRCHTWKLIGLLFEGSEQELGISLKGTHNDGQDLIFSFLSRQAFYQNTSKKDGVIRSFAPQVKQIIFKIS